MIFLHHWHFSICLIPCYRYHFEKKLKNGNDKWLKQVLLCYNTNGDEHEIIQKRELFTKDTWVL